ncbi:XkdX family protein [Lactiplantibacillus pentosus]|nr:XkdX family protein [Lactiplantibacillus pentosus]
MVVENLFWEKRSEASCPIEGYVESGTVTPDEYKQITGNDYAAGANS